MPFEPPDTPTQAFEWHHGVGVASALLPSQLAPVVDLDWLIRFHHVRDLQVWVHLWGGGRWSYRIGVPVVTLLQNSLSSAVRRTFPK